MELRYELKEVKEQNQSLYDRVNALNSQMNNYIQNESVHLVQIQTLQQNCRAWQFKFEQNCQKHDSEMANLVSEFNSQVRGLS